MLGGAMELRHLRYFVAVAEEENVSRAALKLHLSQPALSRQIRDLEEELGFLLLHRGAHSVRLTEAGSAFFREARAVLDRAEEAVRAARAVAAGGGELAIGYAPSVTAGILPPALRAFQMERPAVRVILHDLSTGEMLAGLRSGQLQLAFLVRPTRGMLRGLRFEELARDPCCLAVAPKHPFAKKRAVTLEEAARAPLIAYRRREYPEYHEYLAAAFSAARQPLRIAEEHDSVTSLIAAVEAGSGVALVTRSLACLAGRRVRLLPLAPAPESLAIGAAWHADRLPATAERFLQRAREAASR